MNLILIDPHLMRNTSLLRQNILDLPNRVRIQQAILRSHNQAQRLGHRLEISWNGHQTRVASIRHVGFAMGSQDGISTSLAEPDCPDLACSRDGLDS
jgi:hypothetical protein